MSHLSIMIKPASSLCNMRCTYCFYKDVSCNREIQSYGFMKNETARKLIQNVIDGVEVGTDLTIAFQGGEPTLVGLSFFENFVTYARELTQIKPVKIHYALQTNGLLLDDAWCAFLQKEGFLCGLSLDGNAKFHDENRLDTEFKGTYARVLMAKKLLEKWNVEYNILWVLTNHHARYPKTIWKFLEEQKIQYVQFIPCLPKLHEENKSICALTPERFSTFYTELFYMWEKSLREGTYRSIKLFDDLLHLFINRQVHACGLTGECQMQVVVEADGSVFPCDFYVLDEYCCGNITRDTMNDLFKHPHMTQFLTRTSKQRTLCSSCYWNPICHGGCPRMAHSMYVNTQETFCGYRQFLDGIKMRLEHLIQDLQTGVLQI